ncbi:MAG: hypothetical protein HYZ22_17380 [Chloroflexi bacterium]|nr:hypothetical protein [Chloroflexota bacterium]
MDTALHITAFLLGAGIVVATFVSAISTFVLPRSARSQLNRLVFGLMRRWIEFFMHFAKTYERRDAIMAYYAPLALMLLVPTWYALIALGYSFMYWALRAGDYFFDLRLSGSSLLTLGFIPSEGYLVTILVFSEALLGLIMVGLLIAYLPTMYSAFSRREQEVNMLEVRAGNPPNPYDMLTRFHRIHGLDKLADLWKTWEFWFADVEESHTTLPALVFFRSPRADHSWITSAGAVLDSAAITLSSIDIPQEMAAALCIRAGFISFHRITDYFDISHPHDPTFPETPISVTRAEYDELIRKLEAAGLPIKPDRDQAWKDFAGWRVNYDRTLLVLCSLVMALPNAPWSSDRMPKFNMSPLFLKKKKHDHG